MANKRHTVEVIETDLDLDECIELQKKGWRLQRIGWVLIILMVLFAGLGAFGDGLFSKQKQTIADTEIDYQKFYRYETETKVLVQSKSHIGSISFDQEYLKKFRIVRFVPEPINNTTANNQVHYNFSPGQNLIVSVYLIAKDYGKIEGSLKVNQTKDFSLHHFIYP